MPKSVEEIDAMNAVLNLADCLPVALNVMGKQAQYILSTHQLNQGNICSRVYRENTQSKLLIPEVAFDIDEEQGEQVLNVLLTSLNMIGQSCRNLASRIVLQSCAFFENVKKLHLISSSAYGDSPLKKHSSKSISITGLVWWRLQRLRLAED